MTRVQSNLVGRSRRIVRFFRAEIDAGAGNPPILQPGFAVFPVELAVDEVSWVAERRRPDLLSGALMPGQNGNLAGGVANPIGQERSARGELLVAGWASDARGVPPRDHAVRTNRSWIGQTDWPAALDRPRFAEEDEQALLGQE